MSRFRLRIELLSDMCCGSGEGNGINQDMASSYDEAGLPVIYGKRLKGLIRDRAEFLLKYDWTCDNMQYSRDKIIDEVFGTGEQAGILRVGNAELDKAKTIKRELENLPKELVTPTLVESVYTVQRYSTKINEDGIAEDYSLRMIGAVPKGEVFYAEMECAVDKESCEYQLIEDSCKVLRRIGLNRNRGFGEVCCTLIDIEEESVPGKAEYKETEYKTGIQQLMYIIETESNIISPDDYISGSALQGMFINELLKRSMIEEDEVQAYIFGLRFSNAYLYKNNKRYMPMPMGMKMIKNQSDKIYNMAEGYEPEEKHQYVKTGGYYAIEKEELLQAAPVYSMEYHYAKRTHELFMIHSLSRGQVFGGRIEADESKHLEKLINLINSKKGSIAIGGSTNAQYGAAKFKFIECNQEADKDNTAAMPHNGKKVVVNLISDTVLIDDKGINSADTCLLKEEVSKLFTGKIRIEKVYTDKITVGGYHSKWKLPKRRYTAFAKGTQLVIEGVESLPKQRGFLGILQSEGYGEYEIRRYSSCHTYKLSKVEDKGAVEDIEIKDSQAIITKIWLKKSKDEFRAEAEKYAASYCETNNISSSSAMRFLTAYKAVEAKDNFMKELEEYIKNNFTGDNNQAINKFADNAFQKFKEMWEGKDNTNLDIAGYAESIKQILKQVSNVDSMKNQLFKTFVQGYIEATKLYYRRKHKNIKNAERTGENERGE